MTFKVIGISGAAQCGKDTAADFIIDKRQAYRKVSFAAPMKEMLSVGLGLNQGQLYGNDKDKADTRYGCSPRHMMQTLGTEWGRTYIGDNVWVNAIHAKLENTGGTFVIPDVRFENEADFIRDNGVLINVIGRDDHLDTNHVSESGFSHKPIDIKIINNEDLKKYLTNVTLSLQNIEHRWSS